ncbi:hypothetical protein N7478_003778 [Penicillium angulare]|uniref:uncharacterized protein n=1 Tax=Penicillium angulare TaxID=116970 RepID=UPI0025424B01|nr:uncharacterized protein N7478_003778 [Penicillium angulare]KAJ5288092.1 hypothetical protein N7478_003778 [Penicillium angulare]
MSNGVGTRTLMDGNQPGVSKAREVGLAFPSTSLTRRQRRWGRPRRALQCCLRDDPRSWSAHDSGRSKYVSR